MKKKYLNVMKCDREFIMAVTDTLNVISGKWKLAIVGALFSGKQRFTEIQNKIPGITPRMLSKELKELEINGVLTRNVIASTPVVIEYNLTPSGKLLDQLVVKMVEWGLQHREKTVKRKR